MLKTIDRSATVAWSPVASNLLACGTVAGAIDMSFSTNSVLEVFTLDYASKDPSPALSGSVPVPERFHRIAWGSKPAEASQLPHGILAGGLADGSICLWNPAAILDGSGHNPLLSKMQKHAGAVKGLEFNSFSPNLLASGAADGELCIWDVAAPTQPSLYPSLKGPAAPGAPAAPEITYISWNKKVQHILASTQVDGATVVWDLKKQRPVITLKDPNSQRRCSVLQWNPDVATQLVVASDDDRSPTLQMWDLRNSMSPVKEFVGHTKGVLGMSWCQQDHSLLLSCSKDNRTICWDVATTDIVCELPTQGNWNFDVQWSPTTPGVFSTSTFDGRVSICNVLECTAGSSVETFNADFSSSTVVGDVKPLKKPPTWLNRPSSVCFGFGGRLVGVANHKQQVTDPMTGQVRAAETGAVSISQVVTEHELVQHSESFEQVLAGRDRAALQDFCANKAASATATGAQEEAETWTFMGVLFEEDARRQLLAKLGFQEALMAASAAGSVANDSAAGAVGRRTSVGVAEQQLTSAMEQLAMADGTCKPVIEVPGEPDDFFNQADDPHGFFDSLPDQPVVDTAAAAGSSLVGAPGSMALSNGGVPSEPATPMADPNHVPEGAEKEDEIQKAIFVGNYEGAVDTCLKVGRLADALLIANIGGADLFKKTMNRYMRRNPRPYMAVISAMVDGDYMSLVKTRPVGQWRETLAVLATYTGAEQWAGLCDALASRLAQTGMHHAASLCYICAGNVDQAVAYWSKAVRASGGSVDALQAVIEKSVVLGLATNTSAASTSLADLLATYANTLATQGRMGAALRYLEMVPGEASTNLAVLKDRIYRSGDASVPTDIAAPPFPFQLEDIRPSGQPQTPTGAQYGAAFGAAAAPSAAANQYAANAYGTAAGTQQGGYGGYGTTATAASSGYGAAAPAATTTGYGTAATSGYGAAAGTYGAATAGYGTAASATGYGAAAGGYAQQPQQPSYGQQSYGTTVATGYGAAAAPGGYGSAAAAATGGYGAAAPAAAGYGQQQGAYGQQAGGYGGYGQQQPQQPAPYQPKKPASSGMQTAPLPPATFTPSAPAATGPPAVPTAFTPSMPTSTGASGQQQPVQQRPPMFTPTQSTTVAQPPAAPAAMGSGYGAAPMAGPPAGGMMGAPSGALMGAMPGAGSLAPGSMLTGAPGSGGYGGIAAPAAQKPAAPAPPAGPPAHITMATADVSKVPAEQKPILGSLTNVFNACMPLANTPARKKEMDDNSRRIGGLFWKLNEGQVQPHVVQKLLQLCQALDAGNWPGAHQIQMELTASDWDECGTWLTALKRLIKIRQTMG